jgi:hypothetical protein
MGGLSGYLSAGGYDDVFPSFFLFVFGKSCVPILISKRLPLAMI